MNYFAKNAASLRHSSSSKNNENALLGNFWRIMPRLQKLRVKSKMRGSIQRRRIFSSLVKSNNRKWNVFGIFFSGIPKTVPAGCQVFLAKFAAAHPVKESFFPFCRYFP